MNPQTIAYWRRILVGNLIASAVVLFAFSGATFRTPPAELARNFGIAFLFSSCIAPVLGIAMPRIGPWLWCRLRAPFNWIVVTAVMTVLATIGTGLAIGVLVLIGIVPAGDVTRWFQSSLRVAIVVTLTIGMFITAYEMMRARLAQSTAEAQLASLESRVQPHFLFNTLNSIAALIHDDPAGAERMTTQLASLMRSSLGEGGALVPLGDELRVVRDYLEIERVRFGDRLRFAIHTDDGVTEAAVPRLSIQTLVENSVKYAVSSRREGATIAVRALNGDGRLRVQVQDDGPGFKARELPQGHGLALLEARLATVFGDRAVLEIDSAPGRTIVGMRLPNERVAADRSGVANGSGSA